MALKRNDEVIRLAKADRHIADAKRALANHSLEVERMRFDGEDTEQAEKLLVQMRTSLQEAISQREIIVKTIADIDVSQRRSA